MVSLLRDGANDLESITDTGRSLSAVAAALSVLFLAGVAYLHGGAIAGWCAGLTMCLSHTLLTNAHYMKEDTFLLFGLSAAFLALTFFLRSPSALNVVGLGMGCALAASGKYIGIALLPAMLPFLFLVTPSRPEDTRWKRLAGFFGGFACVALLVNYDMLLHWERFLEAFRFEYRHATTEHFDGLRVKRFGSFYPGLFLHGTLPLVRVFAVIHLAFLLRSRRTARLSEKAMALFPLCFYVYISLSPLQVYRYLLPTIVWTHYLAGMGAADLLAWARMGRRRRVWLGVAVAGLIAMWGTQSLLCLNYVSQFGNDSRKVLRQWVKSNIPSDAVVLQESYAALRRPKQKDGALGFELRNIWTAGRLGSLAEAREQGITHIVVCDLQYRRFVAPSKYPAPGQEKYIAGVKAFYSELFEKGVLLWEYSSPYPMCAFTNPEIRVYRVPDAGASQARVPPEI